jgi:hypothetical protein
LTLQKAPGTIGTGISYYVAEATDMPYEYLIVAALAELYEMASRNRPGVEVEECIRWSNYYRQLASDELKRQARHAPPTRSY